MHKNKRKEYDPFPELSLNSLKKRPQADILLAAIFCIKITTGIASGTKNHWPFLQALVRSMTARVFY